jgi:phosphatidylglycerophosphatase A
VWDEIVAFWLVLLMVTPVTFKGQLWAFIVFRFFDMVKPPPIRYFDRRLKGGFGIMFDDLVAAFFTLLVIALWLMAVLPSYVFRTYPWLPIPSFTNSQSA